MMEEEKIVPGDLIKVPFGQEHTYARVLVYSDLAFYDPKYGGDVKDLQEIIERPILFKAVVNTRWLDEKMWQKVGHFELDESLTESTYYLPDITDENHFRISINGDIREAKREDCIGLEVLAVWDPLHIVQRLKDYTNGVENQALKHLDVLGNYKR